jgi:hypothetical protein
MRYLGGTAWTAKKLRLDMEIDTILKSNKASRPKKRKKEDDLDQFADAEVSQLREEMLNAAELDEQANREKLPATLKLKLLPKVMGALRKCVLFCTKILWQYSIFDCITRSQELSLAVHCR